ncbi:DNA polymeras-like protein delta subunit 4 [Mytilinidion resinicola]|uniref:DNA polymeras-like protein delta subunit 4 n=1 Tax=Mytilinidion resinicola TaxID=574789 RepID=A0A6A6Z538_9PEZI|nr:DNA polymeras-like protein delta subunit 4 [Mytilinidion resinicola]KAF2816242.1 DNA polymeras-like protein delta subunit 4 [Mytilinidion resinicola]
MPPKRRTSAGPRAPAQSTLAFHGTINKVTKPTTGPRSAKSHLKVDDILNASTKPEASDISEIEPDAPTIIQQTVAEIPAPVKPAAQLNAEREARKVSEARIKKYWAAKEKGRLAPRVHQEELGLHEKVLREWDMCAAYGPAIGNSRLKRWNRANRLNLHPPIEVLAVLLMEQDDNNAGAQRAYVDELMNSRFGDEA